MADVKLFKGIDLIVKIGDMTGTTTSPSIATSTPIIGHAYPIITFQDEPTLLIVPTGKQFGLNRDKQGQKIYVFGGSENGQEIETNGMVAGNLSAYMARSSADDKLLDPAIAILRRAGEVLNRQVYVKEYRPMAPAASGFYRYLVKSCVANIKSKQEQQAEGNVIEIPFEIMGIGDLLSGYEDVAI
jgi:hypothetical protein